MAVLMLLYACDSRVQQEKMSEPIPITFNNTDDNGVLAEATDYSLALKQGAIAIQAGTEHRWQMHLNNATAQPRPEKNNAEVIYEEAFEGVDLRIYDKGDGNAAYDLHLKPGARSDDLCFELEGQAEARLNEQGELVLPFEEGEIRHSAPFAYQVIDGKQVEIESHFLLQDDCLSFELGQYDSGYELIIDPTIYEVAAMEEKMMAPSLSINSVSVSGCYLDENGDSKATVSVEVGWEDLATSNNIIVTLGVQTKEIDQTVAVQLASGSFVNNARTLSPPQLVAFEIPANGASLNLEITDSDGVATPVNQNVDIPSECPRSSCPDQGGVIGGNIFADNDFDGDHDPGEINAFEGIRVDIYECNADGTSVLVDSKTSDANGDYFFTGLDDGKKYRLEFFPPANLTEAKPTTIGDDSKSNVRVVEAPACGIDFGLVDPVRYCQENPLMLVPCYGNGDPLQGGDAANVEALILFDYNFGSKQSIASTSEVGTLWGVAINRFTGKAFTSATLRRHSGLGPLGLGGLYITDMDDPGYATGPFLDVVADLGLDIGQGLMPANRNLPTGKLSPSRDPDVFDLIGKVGIGDIDISEDGNILYFINIYEKKLVGLDITDFNNNGTTPDAGDIVLNIDIPEPDGGCVNGELRPFAVKVFEGKVYVGMVCDAADMENPSDLRAIIVEYDGSFTEVFNFPMTYPRGSPASPNLGWALAGGWFPWSDDASKMIVSSGRVIYSQPMLTDIEFDLDGSILIGFLDRAGFQWGYNNYGPIPGDNSFYYNFAGGDVLRAASKGGSFILENNAKAADAEGSNPDNFQGPGNGEFYQDNINFSNTNPGFHTELMLGGLALLPGSGEVIATCVDPVPGQINANGLRRLSNSTGLPTGGLSIYINSNNQSTGTFGKAAGLGDVELQCDVLQIIELGNYVWEDLNGDGIQDPCEPPVENVVVKLYDENGNLLAATQTDADGYYGFSGPDFDGPEVQWEAGADNIAPQTKYNLVFGMGQYNTGEDILQLGDIGYVLTQNDQGSGDNQDMVDSDAGQNDRTAAQGDIMEGFPFIMVMTGDDGVVNHNQDVGLNRVYDYGDAKEDQNGNFPVTQVNNGARHSLGSGLKLGQKVDFEGNGQPDGKALGDDENDPNGMNMSDEDGIDTTSFMLVRCLENEMEVEVSIPDGFGTAYLNMWLDLDGDCEFGNNEEKIASCQQVTDGMNTVTFTIPCDANVGYTYLRARLSSVCDLGSEGTAPNGEVEDYYVLIKGLDFGDLPEDVGYPTTFGQDGAYHIIPPVPLVYLGDNIDTENDGQPDGAAMGDLDDEDSFDPGSVMFVAGRPLTLDLPVFNESGAQAKVVVFVDWNKDGDLVDPGEMFFDLVDNLDDNAEIDLIVPPNAVLNMDLGLRIRISTEQDAVMSPVGLAMDGEVEDYLIQVMGFDFGDLADSGDGNNEGDYETLEANGGPSHKIITDALGNVTLKLGANIDAEGNGQQSTDADGDNDPTAPGQNDEDSFNPASVMFVTGEPVDIQIPLLNMTGQAAKLAAFIDWNNDGDFEDANEKYFTEVLNNANSAILENVTPPLTAVLNRNLGFRLRLSTDMDAAMNPEGPAPDGEVEDFLVQAMGFDYGDLNDVNDGTGGDPGTPLEPADYPTLKANNGARHKILTDENDEFVLKIGDHVDDEADGQPSEDAGETDGDDNTGTPDTDPDDEDGLEVDNLPLFILTQTTELEVPVMNKTEDPATLAVFIDFNKDGAFDPNDEKFTVAVPAGQITPVTVDVVVPVDAVVGQDVGMRLRLANNMNEVMAATGTANSGEVEDYMIQIVGFDYGDLPDSYSTQEPNAPKHIVDENLLLGTCVDSEIDGLPDPMAGMMDAGDDSNPGVATFGECEDGADDEDGIKFISPLIPGFEACIEVTAVNNKGTDAQLQMWIDLNGDGAFQDTEELTLTHDTYADNTIPNGGVTEEVYCFSVPATATFNAPDAFVRFRLSEEGGLEPDEQTLPVPFGEIEDYKVPLSKVGNTVWFDRDYDGIQDNNEAAYGIPGITVELSFTDENGKEYTYTATTDNNGEYYFCGLIEGKYTIEIDNPDMMMPTIPNAGDVLEDDRDSDGTAVEENGEVVGVMEMFVIEDVLDNPLGEDGIEDQDIVNGFPTNEVAGFPDNRVDQAHDFGFVAADFGDLPESYATLLENNGPRHVILPEAFQALLPEIPVLYLGDGVDIEEDGQAAAMSDGDDLNDTDEDNTPGENDENGVELIKPLIPGYESCIKVTSSIPVGVTGVLQGWIDFNGNGELDGNDPIIKDRVLLSGTDVETQICFEVPEEAAFNEGMAFARFRLSQAAGLQATGGAPDGEVEDYKFPLGKIGNLVWEDFDFDGAQDANEPGIDEVEVSLIWLGADNTLDTEDDEIYETLTDEDGRYYFCGLIEGDYKIAVNTPEDMTPTKPDVTLDAEGQPVDNTTDSDGQISANMDLSMVMSEIINITDVTDLVTEEDGNQDQGIVNNFPDNQVDETYDFGFAGLDYGDLPEEEQGEAFNTTMEEGGAIHVIQPDLRLGACVDAEQDGHPDNDAGQFDAEDGDNDLGDDGTESEFSSPVDEDCENDENGIEFITPLIPDNEACIRVTYTAPDGGAVLQGWIDFNGNGEMDENTETLDLPDGGLLAGGANQVILCFEVPEEAVFNDGVAFARFRLSENGGLSPNGPDKYDAEEQVPGGEVEDYRIKLGKVGNLVWEDRNHNGIQDEEEIGLGINGVAVQLIFGGIRADGTLDEIGANGQAEDLLFNTQTGTQTYSDGSELNGIYYFCGLIEGNYEIVVMDPKDLTPTKANNISNTNEEDRDSDGVKVNGQLKVKAAFTFGDQMKLMNLNRDEEGIGDQDLDNLIDPNMVGTFADNQIDQRFDFGYIALDFGDLPMAFQGNAYQYETKLPLGPKHIVTPDLFLGSCVDGELDGDPDLEAGYKGNGKDTGDDGTDEDPQSWKQPQGTDCTDDEDGIVFVTPLVPGYEACIELDFYAVDNFDGPDAFLNAWIDFNGNGQLDAAEHINFTKVNGQTASLEPSTKALELENGFKLDGDPLTLCFEVPEEAQFLEGAAFMRFRLSLDPRLGPDDMLPNGEIPYGEVEDYFVPLTKVGNYVWEDRDFDGIQDLTEVHLGINDVPVALIFSGKNGIIETTDVNDPQGDDRVYETTTDNIDEVAGLYYFCGLIENNTYNYDYKIVVQTPEDMTPTRPDREKNDILDSDGEDGTIADGNNDDGIIDDVSLGMVMTEFEIVDADDQPRLELASTDIHSSAPIVVFTFPDEHVNQTFDFGFAGLDYGDLPDDPEDPEDFATLMMSGGAVHVIQPGKYLGNCVDAEREAAPDDKAGLEEGGDDNTGSVFGQPQPAEGEEACDGDDENGVKLLTPLVAGHEACIEVTFNWPAGELAYLTGWIDFDSDGNFSLNEQVPFKVGVATRTEMRYEGTGAEQTVELCFDLPYGATFPEGRALARFRLSDMPKVVESNGPVKYSSIPMPAGEVEDYLFPVSKIGNLVWEDNDLDGHQDGEGANPSEPGFEGIELTLIHAGYGEDEFGDGDDRVYVTKTDEEGLYDFCGLIPGTYQVFIEKYVECADGYQEEDPARWILTIPNNEAGDKGDQLDSDGDPVATIVIPDPMDLTRHEMGIGDTPGLINAYPDSLDELTIDFGLIEEPNIEAILNDVGYDYPSSHECGNINVIMDLCIKNTEPVPLEKLQAILDLQSQFGPGFVQFVSAEVVKQEGETVEEYPVIDPAYQGGAGNILDGESGLLYPGQVVCLRITAEIDPDAAGAADPLMAQAQVSAKAVNYDGVAIPDWCNGGEQFMVMDLSNDRKKFQGGYDDDDHSTRFSDCWKDVHLIAQNDVVYVPVDENCQMTITADMLLEGFLDKCSDEQFPQGGFYRVRYNDEEILGEIKVDVADYNVGEPLVFEVRTVSDFCNPVWGYVVPEDKAAASIPEVNGELMLVCTDVDSIKQYFQADITQDKDDCTFSGVSWDLLREAGVFNIDELQDGCTNICQLDIAISDLFMPGDACTGSMMLRTMRIKDAQGNVSTVEIPIRFEPVDLILDDIMVDHELDLCAYPGASDNDLLRLTGVPYYINGFGDKVYLDKNFLDDENKAGLCNVSIGYEDKIIPDNCVKKIERTWTIWDWCKEAQPITKVQHIKWGQLSAPLVTCPPRHTDTVSTGPFDCTASFILPEPIVESCVNNEFDYSVKVYREQVKRDPTGLPVKPLEYETVLYPATLQVQADGTYLVGGLEIGTYYIGYNVTDACGNVADEVRCKYVVVDKTAPIAVCDDELHVSVGGDGIAHITVEDVNEGSWDNCELADLKIRRGLDSCYDSYLSEVYGIAGIGELHEIETTDKHGEPLYLYYRVEGGRDTLLMKQMTSDSTYRFYTYWRDELWFTCCDISKSAEDFVKIELKATDKYGNENICWQDQLIENKLTPTCWAPADTILDCTTLDFDATNLEAVRAKFGTVEELLASGELSVDFNCDYIVTDTIAWDSTACSTGILKRIFTVTAPSSKGIMSSTCEQIIEIVKKNDYVIKFPADAEDTCNGDAGEDLELETFACDVFAVHRDTALFESADDACFKRYITYRVINWCEYDGITLQPTVIPRDYDCDGDLDECTWVKVDDNGNFIVDDDASVATGGIVPGIVEEELKAGDDNFRATTYNLPLTDDTYNFDTECDNKTYEYTAGYWEYTQVVKVYDDEAPIVGFDTLEFCAFGATGAADCHAEVMIPVAVIDSCTEKVDIRSVLIDVDSQGKEVNGIDELYTVALDGDTLRIASIAGKGLPVGDHRFTIAVADQCGNVVKRVIPFSIVDCKTPAPICVSILSVDLMPVVENKVVIGGENTVWATDFVASGIIDCTPHEQPDVIAASDNNVRYYAVRQDELLAAGLETPTAGYLNETYRSVRFTCADNGAAVAVFVIAEDGAGNFDFCTVMVNVQPGVDPSPCTEESTDSTGRAAIAGLITTMEDQLVEGVEVLLSGQDDGQMRTDLDGSYAFDHLQMGYDYSIAPRLDADPMNGVSTFDLVKITQHILGTSILDHPLLMIAADVNNSRSITTLDLIQLRKMILSIDEHFNNNTSWRFIDASYEFPDPANPWAEPIPEIVNINDLDGMRLDVDFYAVKIGDVNMSAIANNLMLDERNVNGVFEMKVEDQYIEAGQTYELTLSSDQLDQVLGYQYTLSFDHAAMELKDIAYGILQEQNLGLTHLDEGMITVSWNDPAGQASAESTADLLTLTFRAYQSGQLSEMLGVSSRYTMAEAYDLSGQLQDVAINFGSGKVTGVGYELYQNLPNPFMTQTVIGFNLPQAAQGQMILRDSKGKVLQIVKGDYAKGYNMIRFERDNLPTGVIYYTLKSGEFTATRRMIIVE